MLKLDENKFVYKKNIPVVKGYPRYSDRSMHEMGEMRELENYELTKSSVQKIKRKP